MGGFVFGLGAAINGGCSYSTRQRIADGDPGGLASIVGIMLGVLTWSGFDASLGLTRPIQATALWVEIGAVAPWRLGVLAPLAPIEVSRLWRHAAARQPWRRLAAPRAIASARPPR